MSPPPIPQRVKFPFMVRFCWNLKQCIFTCLPIKIDIKIYGWGYLASPPPNVKFFIYDAILLKSETRYFHMFTNDSWDSNLWLGVTLPPSPLQKSNYSFMMRFCWNLKPINFICVPIIIKIIFRYVGIRYSNHGETISWKKAVWTGKFSSENFTAIKASHYLYIKILRG